MVVAESAMVLLWVDEVVVEGSWEWSQILSKRIVGGAKPILVVERANFCSQWGQGESEFEVACRVIKPWNSRSECSFGGGRRVREWADCLRTMKD